LVVAQSLNNDESIPEPFGPVRSAVAS
jgi:hypothetical protein